MAGLGDVAGSEFAIVGDGIGGKPALDSGRQFGASFGIGIRQPAALFERGKFGD